jgi:hypothetical protein
MKIPVRNPDRDLFFAPIKALIALKRRNNSNLKTKTKHENQGMGATSL